MYLIIFRAFRVFEYKVRNAENAEQGYPWFPRFPRFRPGQKYVINDNIDSLRLTIIYYI